MTVFAVIFGLLAATPSVVFALESDSDTAEARAKITTPVVLVRIADLNFGTIIPDAALPGTIIVDADNGSATDLNVVAVNDPTNPSARAQFQATGVEGSTLTVSLGPPPLLTSQYGDQMPVMALTLDSAGAERIFPASSLIDIGIGGILSVGADQAYGDYEGTFDVTVNMF